MVLTTYKISVRNVFCILHSIDSDQNPRCSILFLGHQVRRLQYNMHNVFKLFECLHLLRSACVIIKTMIDVFTL